MPRPADAGHVLPLGVVAWVSRPAITFLHHPLAAFAAMLLLATGRAPAQQPPDAWRSVGVGGGGALFSPSFSPHDPDELFLACDMSELFHSRDLGASWSTIPFTQIQGNRHSKAQFTSDPDILYCLDYSVVNLLDLRRPVRSTDGGATWTPLAGDPTGGEVYSLRADPARTDRVLINSWNRLYVSNDSGATFQQRYQASDGGAGLHIGGVFFDGNTIYVGTNDGLLVSTNGGTSFALDGTGGIAQLGQGGGNAIVSFAGARSGATVRLFALVGEFDAVYNGMPVEDLFWPAKQAYMLEPGAGSWVRRDTGLPTTDGNGLAFLDMARNAPDVVWASGQASNENPLIYRSTDAGVTWSLVLHVTNNQNAATGWAGHQGDRGWTYGAGSTGFAVAPLDANRAAYSDYGFIHLTTDGGATWRQAYLHPEDQNPAGSATPKGRAYRGVGLENTSCWWLCWADDQSVFAGFSDIRGIRSTDGGNSWAFDYTGHTENSAYCILRHPNGTLYMATSTAHDIYQSTYLTDSRLDNADGRIVRSTDGGVTWQLLHDFNNPVIQIALDPNQPNHLYASVIDSQTGGIYRTTNLQDGASATWSALAVPPRTEGHPFNIRVLNDGTLVATYSGRRTGSGFTASSGVFVSTNGGTSWLDRSHPGMLYWTKDITIDPHDPTQDTWYVGVFSGWGGPPNGLGGLYRTTDRGLNWTRLTAIDRVGSATVHPTRPDELYLTTEIDGLWHCANLRATTPSFARVESFPFRQPERVFFHPSDPEEVWVTSFGGGIRIGRTGSATASPSGLRVY